MVVIMMMILSSSQDLASLLVEIAFLLDARQLDLQPLKVVLQVSIRRLEVVALLQPLAATILSVATILQGPSLLLQTHDLRTTRTVLRANLVETGKRERDLLPIRIFIVHSNATVLYCCTVYLW